MAIKIVTPPNSEPITLGDMKDYLRVDDTTDDMLISSLISVAREFCEGFQNRAYITQTMELTMDYFPSQYRLLYYGLPFESYNHRNRHHHKDAIKIPMPPLQSVVSITYTDDTGVTTTLDPSTYIVDLDSEPGKIVPSSGNQWPTVQLQPVNGVRVRYIAGYGNSDAVPNSIKQVIKMLVAHWYENRGAVGTVSEEIAFAVKAILSQQRVIPT